MSVYDYCISLSDGINWTRNWRKADRELKAHSFVFHADKINAILKEPGVVKMRFYIGLEISGKNDEVLEKLV